MRQSPSEDGNSQLSISPQHDQCNSGELTQSKQQAKANKEVEIPIKRDNEALSIHCKMANFVAQQATMNNIAYQATLAFVIGAKLLVYNGFCHREKVASLQ